MKQENLEAKLAKMESHLAENDGGATGQIIISMIADARTGEHTEEENEKIWAAVRSMNSILPTPAVLSRRAPSLDAGAEAVLSAVLEAGHKAAQIYFDTVGQVITKRGGGLYADANEYADAQMSLARRHMTDRFPEIWDGTQKGLGKQTFPEINEEDQG